MPVKKKTKKSKKSAVKSGTTTPAPQQIVITQNTNRSWVLFIFSMFCFLVIIFFFIVLFASLFSDEIQTGNLAVIPIHGMIQVGSDSSPFSIDGASSTQIVKFIEKAEKDDQIKVILLDINSPGGTAVASEEIANAVKDAEKPVIAVIRELGASGAFWISTAADRVYASENSITGSIGVIGSYIEFAGLMEKYNLTYRRLVAGKYKDAGTPLKPLGAEEEKIIQSKLDIMHTNFINAVSENRKMSSEKVRDLATGMIYLGSEAKEFGLIDEIGSKTDAIKYIEKQYNMTAEPIYYKRSATIVDLFTGMQSNVGYSIGKGIGETFTKAQPQFMT